MGNNKNIEYQKSHDLSSFNQNNEDHAKDPKKLKLNDSNQNLINPIKINKKSTES